MPQFTSIVASRLAVDCPDYASLDLPSRRAASRGITITSRVARKPRHQVTWAIPRGDEFCGVVGLRRDGTEVHPHLGASTRRYADRVSSDPIQTVYVFTRKRFDPASVTLPTSPEAGLPAQASASQEAALERQCPVTVRAETASPRPRHSIFGDATASGPTKPPDNGPVTFSFTPKKTGTLCAAIGTYSTESDSASSSRDFRAVLTGGQYVAPPWQYSQVPIPPLPPGYFYAPGDEPVPLYNFSAGVTRVVFYGRRAYP